MKVNFGATMKDMDGSDVIENGKPVTLAAIGVVSLLANFDKENPAVEEKLARYRIAHKIKDGGIVDLTVEELSVVKAMVGKVYGTMIVGQAFQLLENSV